MNLRIDKAWGLNNIEWKHKGNTYQLVKNFEGFGLVLVKTSRIFKMKKYISVGNFGINELEKLSFFGMKFVKEHNNENIIYETGSDILYEDMMK